MIDPGDEPTGCWRRSAERGWSAARSWSPTATSTTSARCTALAEATGGRGLDGPGDADELRALPPAPHEPEHLVDGGETCSSRRDHFRTFDVPGHTAGSVAFAADGVAFVGDVLFAGSVGRTDLAGGDLAR